MPTHHRLLVLPGLRWRIVIGLIAGLAAGFANIPAGAQQLAVLSRDEDALMFLDLTDGSEVQRLDVGRMCHEIEVDDVRTHAYTASFRGNSVHAIDLKARTTTSMVIEGFQHLHGVELSPAGDVLFVTSEDPSAVVEVDPISGELIRFFPLPGLHAHLVTVTPEGNRLYVGSEKPGAVSLVDRTTGTVEPVLTGNFVVDLRIAPDSASMWVTIRDEGRIAIVDLESNEVTSTFESGGDSPAKLRFRPNTNEVWITNHLGETVTVLDRTSHELLATVHVGKRPLAMTFTDDGSLVYVSRTRANEIVEIDAAKRKILRRIPTGGNPDGMVWLPGAHSRLTDRTE